MSGAVDFALDPELEKLAEKADLHPVYISMVERGVRTISVDALIRIATALNIRLRDLIREI